MFCPKCGKESNGKFCAGCGTKIPDGTPVQHVQQPVVPPVQQSVPQTQPFQYVAPSRKNNTGWIVAAIVGGFLLFAIIVGALSGDGKPSASSSAPPVSSQQEEVTSVDDAVTGDGPSSENPETESPEQVETSEEVEKPESDDELTMGQINALAKALQYLDYLAFSYKGLIEQLEYEQFSHEDAVYAVDNCGADWNEQAAKKAKEYLDYSSFSRAGLIEQLEYEGFTKKQAVYGVEANGY